MTIQYRGMRRMTTDVLDDYGQAHYLQNVRLKRVGEMGRRAGLGKSTMAQLAGPVQFMIGAWSNAPYIVNGTGGAVTGTENPLAYWTGATMRIPDGQVGQPSAPVIVSVTATPATAAYPAGTVFLTAVVTYDGLSGALSYLWQNYNIGAGTPTLVINNANPGEYDFNAGCIPDTYSRGAADGLTVTTALNGFSVQAALPNFIVT